MRRAAAQLLDRLGPVDFQVAAVCGSNGMRGRCGSQREAVFLRETMACCKALPSCSRNLLKFETETSFLQNYSVTSW